MDINITPDMAIMVTLTIGVTQYYKKFIPKTEGKMQKIMQKIIPVISMITGILLSISFFESIGSESIQSGLIVGLTASGVFTAGRHLAAKD